MTAAPITDPQRRLLATIGQRLPAERVRELYLFAPMRQGGVETGLAVVASGEPEPVATPATPEAVSSAPGTAPTAADTAADTAAKAAADTELDVATPVAETAAARLTDAACDPTDAAAGAPPTAELPSDVTAQDEPSGDAFPLPDLSVEEAALADAAPDAAATRASAPARFTIYTARYRLQLKGPDRGKWEAEVVEEADAPLLTVDAVVRGVQRRAGESTEVERLTGAEFLQLLAGGP